MKYLQKKTFGKHNPYKNALFIGAMPCKAKKGLLLELFWGNQAEHPRVMFRLWHNRGCFRLPLQKTA
jgi:hypothetical protein